MRPTTAANSAELSRQVINIRLARGYEPRTLHVLHMARPPTRHEQLLTSAAETGRTAANDLYGGGDGLFGGFVGSVTRYNIGGVTPYGPPYG